MNRRAADGSTRNRRHRLPLSAATPTVCKPAGKARRSRAVNTLTGKPTRDSQALEAEIAWLTTEIAQARARLVTAQRGADEPFWQTPIGRSGFRSKASFYRMSRTYPPTESAIGRRRCGVAWANACQSSGHLLRAARVAIPSPSTDVSVELRRQPGVLDCRRAIGGGHTFWIFAVICVLALVFSARFVPETKDRGFAEVNAAMQRRFGRGG